MPIVLYIDLGRCIDCRACEVACEREHHGRANIFVQRFDELFSLPVSCRHCETSFCTTVCPTGALYRSEDGLVLSSPMLCVGCQQCVLACPFGAIWFDTQNKVVSKCDMCIHRLAQNLEPACVATCSAKALDYGELADLASGRLLTKGRTIVQRASGAWGTLITLPQVPERAERQ